MPNLTSELGWFRTNILSATCSLVETLSTFLRVGCLLVARFQIMSASLRIGLVTVGEEMKRPPSFKRHRDGRFLRSRMGLNDWMSLECLRHIRDTPEIWTQTSSWPKVSLSHLILLFGNRCYQRHIRWFNSRYFYRNFPASLPQQVWLFFCDRKFSTWQWVLKESLANLRILGIPPKKACLI